MSHIDVNNSSHGFGNDFINLIGINSISHGDCEDSIDNRPQQSW
jgi:hypothetical protein